MIRIPTLFVLGAGASYECGLPIGSELKRHIATNLDLRFEDFNRHVGRGDLRIYERLREAFPHEINDYLGACWRIRDGVVLSDSIDDFVDLHRDDPRITICGKLAIARSILEAERNSKLFFESRHVSDTIDFMALADTWFAAFYSLLTRNVTRAELDAVFEHVTVINFNYDRCLEQFLVCALATTYAIKIDEARQRVDALTILRPYGQVGAYLGNSGPVVPFGSKSIPTIESVMSALRTYTERIEDPVALRRIRSAVAKAEVIVFLGSAFHENNMRVLTDPTAASAVRSVYFTRCGIADADMPVVERRLRALRGKDHAKKSGTTLRAANTCADLFLKDYRLSLRESVGAA